MFDDGGNKLNPNDDDNLDDSPVLDDDTRVQGRIKFKIKRCTDNDD